MLACLYGEELSTSGQHEAAGAMFARASDWQRALVHFERALNWHLALTMANALHLPDTDMASLAHRLAGTLHCSGNGGQHCIVSTVLLCEYITTCANA